MSASAISKDFFSRSPQAKSLMQLLDVLPEVYLYVKNESGNFILVNSAMLPIYGVQELDEVIGRTDYDFHPPVLADAYRIEDKQVMTIGKPLLNRLWLVPNSKGTPHWYVSSKTPISSTEGVIIGIAGVMYRVGTPENQKQWFGKLQPAMEFIEANYTQKIHVTELAQLSGISVTHFNRSFRNIFNTSPTQYLLSRKIQEARRMLTSSNLTIIEIAHTVGFYDQSHFTRIFRKETGLTPRAYVLNFRQKPDHSFGD